MMLFAYDVSLHLFVGGLILLNAPAEMVSWTYSIKCRMPQENWTYSVPIMVQQAAQPSWTDPKLRLPQFPGSWTYSINNL